MFGAHDYEVQVRVLFERIDDAPDPQTPEVALGIYFPDLLWDDRLLVLSPQRDTSVSRCTLREFNPRVP